jgi:hypothetical protein
MALGKQFENTYWYTNDGDVRTSLVSDDGQSAVMSKPMPEDYLDFHVEIMNTGRDDDDDTPETQYVENLQGTLFNPYQGTGLYYDQLTSEKSREGAARRAMRMDDASGGLEAYKKGVQAQHGVRVSDEVALRHQDLAVDELTGTHMPVWEMNKVADQGNARVAVSPNEGRSHYSAEVGPSGSPGGRIGLHVKKRPRWAGGGESIDGHTLVHEMGHAKDRENIISDAGLGPGSVMQWKNPGKRGKSWSSRGEWVPYGGSDPRDEGVADGYMDTYGGRNPKLLQSAINNPEFAETQHANTGYSTKYSGFKTNAHRAIYSAMRAHVGMGGDIADATSRADVLDIPELNVEERMNNVKPSKGGSDIPKSHVLHEATLGHIWETMPHVRGHLSRLGFHRDAMKAAAENKLHRDEWTRKNVGEQLDLGI